ncbi:MAG: hypothetical protein NC213_03595 [Acetobacter sp.]|nr:hypothetical protein [Bacteroides sp.]MCM1340807.1 hypothetical protein [Acetobacter sp.]MCM1432636.1 hypothetical protein [Clostridiales bacterium]
MAKLTEEQLRNWLKSDEYMISNNGTWGKEQLFKIPLNDDFTFIYYKRTSQEDSFGLNKDLKNVGLYYKQDGCIYNSDYYIKSMCEETPIFKIKTQKSDFAERLTEFVKGKVEAIIDNNVNNLSTREISDEWKLKSVAYFIEHTAKDQARELFLSETEVADIEYECHHSIDNMTDIEYIRFITDKDALAAEKADEYVKDKQEDILVQFYQNTALRKELQKIYDDPEHELYKIKAIMNAVERTCAKTVNITVNKDNKEFTFKYDADRLRLDPKGHYWNWGMKSSDERTFENIFGGFAHFYANDITKITYCRNVIYDSSAFDMTETEDTAMAQTM